jgi:CspA family cold shock protein
VSATGVVRIWHPDKGWGVLDSEATPGGCWAHFSSIRMSGYKQLREGQPVTFDFGAPGQDGYDFRAVDVWPSGGALEDESEEDEGPSEAYGSSLTITWDPLD